VKKVLKKILLGALIIVLLVFGYFFVGWTPQAKQISWGVNFSQQHAELLGLDWKVTYLALLNDLKVKNLKIPAQWDLIEPEKDKYNFKNLDWQMQKAGEQGAKVLLVLGMKTGRWPECHLPAWAGNLSKEEQQKKILDLIREIVSRYSNSSVISSWQVENEPFFPFGACPWSDEKFLAEEIKLVKELDSSKRPVIISDSGEGSLWIKTAEVGDLVGITMYKKVWFREWGTFVNYPFPPIFYWRKAQIVKALFNKNVMVVELQAEPWGKNLLYDSPLSEQNKTMNLAQFRYNVEFAKKTGFNTFYLWGSEWWYWLKTKQNRSDIWQEAKKLF
jgi:hypothetical protein